MNEDWWSNPKSGEQVDFIDFCRSEGRFAKHFDRDGNPSELLELARQDRLENWHVLQELAGVLEEHGGKKAEKAAAAPAPRKSNGDAKPKSAGLPAGLVAGRRIRYNDGRTWVEGVVGSVQPVILALDDDTEIEVPPELLSRAVAAGIVVLN